MIENVPFRIRQIATTHGCPPSRKAALNHSSMKKPSTWPSHPRCECAAAGRSIPACDERRSLHLLLASLARPTPGRDRKCFMRIVKKFVASLGTVLNIPALENSTERQGATCLKED